VKDALDGMSYGNCAYCESKINASRSAQVEHFKPKSLFPTLTYDWDNYFLSCNGCNGTKLDKWPRSGGYVRPDRGQPSRLFVFHRDGRMEAQRDGSDADRTVTDFGLDQQWLRRARKVAINSEIDAVDDIINTVALSVEDKRRLVRRRLQRAEAPSTPYSVALSQNIRRTWQESFPGVPL